MGLFIGTRTAAVVHTLIAIRIGGRTAAAAAEVETVGGDLRFLGAISDRKHSGGVRSDSFCRSPVSSLHSGAPTAVAVGRHSKHVVEQKHSRAVSAAAAHNQKLVVNHRQ
jgi:hypothetical protein